MGWVVGSDSLLGLPALFNTEMRFGIIEKLLRLKLDEVLSASPNTDETVKSNNNR